MKKQTLLKEFFKYTSFNVLGMLGLSCYILADTFFVAKGLGQTGLAALNLAIPVFNMMHGCGLMLGMGGATKYSILSGKGDLKQRNKVFTNTLYLAAAFSAAFVLVGAFFSVPISRLLGADAQILPMTDTYLKVLLLFAPAYILNDIVLCFVRNDAAPGLAMIAMVTGSLSNVLLDYIFIFPLGMGMFGAVFATGLAPIISLAVLSVHFFRRKNGFRIQKAKPDLKLTGSTFSLGLPSFVTEMASGVVIIMFNALILNLEGNVGVAAYGVVANLSLVVAAIYTGIAQGIQPLLGRDFGRGDGISLKKVLRYALLTVAIVSAAVYTGVFLFAGPISGMFNSQGDAFFKELAVSGLRLYFIAAPFMAFNVIVQTYFTSTAKPKPSQVVSLLRGIVLIVPAAFLTSSLWGLTGVWLAFPITELLTAAVCLTLFLVLKRKNKNGGALQSATLK